MKQLRRLLLIMLLGVNASISYAQETMTFSELGFAEGVPINSPIVGTLFTIQFSMSEYYYPDVFIEPFSTISIKSNDPLRNILNIMFEFHDLGYPITLLFSTPTGYFTSGVNSTTWQGRANQITITNNSPDPIFLNRVTVTLEADPELSFSSTFANAFLYDQNVLPALNNPHSVTPISYISSNQTVATVDNVTGNVTLIGMGDADITAIYFGNDTYKASSATYHLTVLPPPPVTIIMNAEKYMTFYYGDRAFRVPPGVTAYTYKVNGTTLTPAKIYVEGDVIPKGQAVVLHAEEGAYPFIVVVPYTVTPSTSNLYGYDVDTSIPADANSLFYMLSQDASSTPGSVGFYWGADNGASFTILAHKAYLKVSKGAPLAKGFRLDGLATGIESANVAETDKTPAFNLAAQRVTESYKGVIIKKGKKYVVK